jgi:cell division FtsZ-interacting protein ZapD
VAQRKEVHRQQQGWEALLPVPRVGQERREAARQELRDVNILCEGADGAIALEQGTDAELMHPGH